MTTSELHASPRASATLGILLAVCLVAPALAADDESSDSDDHSPLHEKMEAIGDSYGHLLQAFRKAPDLAATPLYLKWAETLHTNLAAATQLTPARAEALGDEEQAAMNAAFKKDITAAATTAQKLLDALKKDDLKQAATLIAQLKMLRNAAHEKYREPDDDE
ncbi:MAG: hypothetical protein O2901_00570 [Verrucomicrobia bacterium]|nr:hypothetical protein [Verrucomicrobiota bacterium]